MCTVLCVCMPIALRPEVTSCGWQDVEIKSLTKWHVHFTCVVPSMHVCFNIINLQADSELDSWATWRLTEDKLCLFIIRNNEILRNLFIVAFLVHMVNCVSCVLLGVWPVRAKTGMMAFSLRLTVEVRSFKLSVRFFKFCMLINLSWVWHFDT